jgi:trk system potassium uptake protein TrkH
MGGIGFIVWNDMITHKFRRYELHSKIVLIATAVLIIGGWALYCLYESNGVLANMCLPDKMMAALFQSVTRTAGFSTIRQNELSEGGSFLTMMLMFIGGSPGSTAGGIKTIAFSILALNAWSSIKKYHGINIFKREIGDETVKQAGGIVVIYAFAIVFMTLIICALEPFSLKEILFEVVSAIGTVGHSMGITPYLKTATKLLIVLSMFFGKIGWLVLILRITAKQSDPPVERITENIMI